MTDSEKIEHLEKEVEVLKKRVNYFYNEIRPILQKVNCKSKHAEVDSNGRPIACYQNHPCMGCYYYKEADDDRENEIKNQ